MPQRLALALQADGWILRSRMPGGQDMRPDVIWRSNKMPESVRDRPSKDFEDVLIFAKRSRYFWDQEAGREEAGNHMPGSSRSPKTGPAGVGVKNNASLLDSMTRPVSARNMRTAWTPADVVERAPMREMWDIPSEPTKAEHFAAWPEMLAARLIAVGTSERGCCPECGARWERVVESFRALDGKPANAGSWKVGPGTNGAQGVGHWRFSRESKTLGWAPGCSCYPETDNGATDPDDWPAEPCRVLDPFTGVGRTWQSARRLGRAFFGVDLSPSYCLTARRRNAGGLPVEKLRTTGQVSLFEPDTVSA